MPPSNRYTKLESLMFLSWRLCPYTQLSNDIAEIEIFFLILKSMGEKRMYKSRRKFNDWDDWEAEVEYQDRAESCYSDEYVWLTLRNVWSISRSRGRNERAAGATVEIRSSSKGAWIKNRWINDEQERGAARWIGGWRADTWYNYIFIYYSMFFKELKVKKKLEFREN